MNTKKDSYTIIFAIIMVVIVGSLLAFLSESLKPKINENKRFEKQQNILYAMGVHENEGNSVTFIGTDKVEETFGTYIVRQLVIENNKASEQNDAYLIDIKKEETKAKNKSYTRKLPLFIGHKDEKEYYIVPVQGKGLWDAIWGYVALDKEGVVQGVYFDHKAETPGLGANINQRFFMDDFIGENLFSNEGVFKGIKVFKGNADPKNNDKNDNEVDAIAGATITGDGVSKMIQSSLKPYLTYLESLQ